MRRSRSGVKLLGLLLMAACLMAVAPGLTASAQAGARKQVVFIRYRIEPNHFQTLVDSFKATMAAQGFKEGMSVEYVDILTSSADMDSVPEVVTAVNRYKQTADLFVTCGWVSIPARSILAETKVPQLFVPVLESVARNLLPDLPDLQQMPATNLSGVYLRYPPEKILRVARFVIPGIKSYAYIYDSRIPADMVFKSAFEKLETDARHGIEVFCFDLAAGVGKVMAAMREKRVQAYGGIVGSFKHSARLNRLGIPQVTALTLDIDQQTLAAHLKDEPVLAGLFNPFDDCGRQAAEMAADILTGKKRIEETRPRPARQVAFINLKAAERLGLRVSFDVLEAVDLVIK